MPPGLAVLVLRPVIPLIVATIFSHPGYPGYWRHLFGAVGLFRLILASRS